MLKLQRAHVCKTLHRFSFREEKNQTFSNASPHKKAHPRRLPAFSIQQQGRGER